MPREPEYKMLKFLQEKVVKRSSRKRLHWDCLSKLVVNPKIGNMQREMVLLIITANKGARKSIGSKKKVSGDISSE